MKITIDSNILIYALDRTESVKNPQAVELMIQAGRRDNIVLTAQAIGEFINVIRRKRRDRLHEAMSRMAEWAEVFTILPTTTEDLQRAIAFAETHALQFWDALIWQVARADGVKWLLSEDMQDGLSINGMTVIDPFNAANRAKLAMLLR